MDRDTSLQVDLPLALATTGGIRRALDELLAERRRVERAVATLLDGGWAGRAADQYAEGWAQWQQGCDGVLSELETMVGLVEAAHVVVDDTDGAVAASGSRLHQRLEAS